MRWAFLLAAIGCTKQLDINEPGEPLDTVLVPGCPSEEDGALSRCQWDRVLWAHRLWEDGVTRTFITSGNAVYNPYIEAEALRAGLIGLGVPGDVIYTETQALHSDENIAYALAMMEELDLDTVGVATHPGHTTAIRQMARGWGHQVVAIPIDMGEVRDVDTETLPEIRTSPVDDDEWIPLKRRERVIAARLGFRPRLGSFLVYTAHGLRGIFLGESDAPTPPTPEPTLRGRRHRVDTAPWVVADAD